MNPEIVDYNYLPAWLRLKMSQTTNPRLRTTEGVARALHVSRTSPYNWLHKSDKCRPRTGTAIRMAQLFGVSPEEVLSLYVSRKPGRKPGS